MCDNKKNVLIIIKSDIGYIFGGYCKIGFEVNNKEYKIDNNCFLFSYNLKKIYPVVKDMKAICHINIIFGLCFYASLTFEDNFMKIANSKVCGGMQYSSYFNGINARAEMNGGNSEFTCKELEVFQLLKEDF